MYKRRCFSELQIILRKSGNKLSKVCETEAMSKASQLQSVLERLLISDNDRAPYTVDAIKICNELMDDLKSVDSQFSRAYDGLSLSGSYLDRLKLKTPDEFDMHLKLKLPFRVKPERDYQRAGFVFLRAKECSHPAVQNDYVNRKTLQDWLRNAFTLVFKKYNIFTINGVQYKLSYEQQGYGCAHTIEATSTARTISFDFVPVFEFNYNEWPLPAPSSVSSNVRQYWNWFAVPQQKRPNDDRTFMVCAPHWEREMMKDKNNCKNSIRLMKALRDKYSAEMPHLSSYMLKTVVLLQLDKRSDYFWQQDLATVFLTMWSELVKHLEYRNLPFFLANDCNHFDRMKPDEVSKCSRAANQLMNHLNSNNSIVHLFN